ncbi:MAG: class I SAM-dependent methyltransferase [Cyanobacteria bacterium J06621_11]
MNNVASSLVNGVLSIKPLARFAKNRARSMMMDRAETLGVYWRDEVKVLRSRNHPSETERLNNDFHPQWEKERSQITNPTLAYPSYYTSSFHAYDEGNLGWLPAMEVSAAARAVHARIWSVPDERAGVEGDASLRSSYHQALSDRLPAAPSQIIDLGCSTGLSSFALQKSYPSAQITGVDLSPHFLTVAQYVVNHSTTGYANVNADELAAGESVDGESASGEPTNRSIRWVHAAAEETGLPEASADLVSACLVFHELPTTAARNVMTEAYRLVRPGGHFAIMDMDPQSEAFAKMPPYVLTLLKSTEPFLDQYFTLDIAETLKSIGFDTPHIVRNSPRHRTVIAQKPTS